MVDIVKVIENVYKNGDLSFLLSTYVDRDYYLQNFRELFVGNYIENMTDFSYSKCFSICINLSDIDSPFGSQLFEKFISENGNIYRVDVQMSLIAPYAVVKYLKYEKKDNTVVVQSSNVPFLSNQNSIDGIIRGFLSDKGYTVLDDNVLTKAVPGVVLELQEDTPSVYNCLFEDSSSYYPYSS
ncbi:hypothetical protein DFP94_107181 [Fontibacillus phaseoli]|uniref:Uncharacterized protein n=1 Tax=Fontibacillus phaseoli TaxID=1416533 RepID=A0A369BCC8_9BACL|nr:hypothetical protein [Fontibacillus phaseoli]RCX18226.1 hypothetical protein DFP94_107181 [Fontibacillus phaseoli]